MSDLPDSWIQTEIGKLCSLKNGRAFKPNEWQTSGLPIVRIQNLNNPTSAFNHFQGEVDERNRLRGGELLFAWSGTPGTSFGAHVWRGGDAVLNQHIFRVDFDEALLDKRFFRFAINQKLSELIDVAHGGVGLRHVTKGVFENTLVALPPRSEQTRIANKLDILLTRIQSCNDRFDAIPALLKRFRQTVLDAALNGAFLDGAAAAESKQPKVAISTIASVGTGSTPLRSNSQFFASSGTPWITSSATSAAVVTSANEFVTPAAISAHRLKLFPKGTLLVAMYGEGKTRGQVAELGIEATINQACAAVEVNESKAIRAYVKLALQANYLNMRELAEGGNQPNLNLSKVKEFEIPLPSLAEQAEIVRRVDALLALADRIEARCTAARTQAQRLTPLVLAKAFRGELVQQDPQDEPASVLLQRLAATKPTKVAASRGRPRTKQKEIQPTPLVLQPNWTALPDDLWAAPEDVDEHAVVAVLVAVLKAWGGPMPQAQARLAAVLCQQPRLMTAALPAEQAMQWRRLVGSSADPLPTQVTLFHPATSSQWRKALAGMRARGDLVETGTTLQGTWALGSGAAQIETAGWPDGRAGWVVAYLRAHDIETILPVLETPIMEFVYARAV